jgi:hypothetical protein
MGTHAVRMAVINIREGSPDPYLLNDALRHVGGNTIEFTWAHMDGDNIPTHYVVYNETVAFIPAEPCCIVDYALVADQCAKLICEGKTLTAIHEMDKARIENVDTEVDDGEIKFTLRSAPDTWIHVLWLQ